APVDVARVLSHAHHLEAEEVVAVSAADRSVSAGGATGRGRREMHCVDGGIDDELTFGGDLARLLEEAEREARRDAESDVEIAPALGGRSPVRRDLRRLRADLEEEATLVCGLT